MLTLTEDATQAIQGLVGDRSGAGLRIFSKDSNGDELQLGLAISDGPEPTDRVVEQSGCHVFLDEQVAPLLDGRTLDARPEGQQVQFSFVA
jgi:Fe-S cluster assembly iron-binding protein IscA